MYDELSIYERAELARDVEYVTCMVEDGLLNDIIEVSSNPDSIYDDDYVDDIIPDNVEDENREEEIDRIMKSDNNMNLDDVIGINNPEVDPYTFSDADVDDMEMDDAIGESVDEFIDKLYDRFFS